MKQRSRVPLALFTILVVASLDLWVAAAAAQVVDSTLWSTNGTVSAIARDGNTIYIGGDFTKVGPATGGYVPLSAETGALLRPFPKVLGEVRVAAPDGLGGWYIGGAFTAVGGLPRWDLAHILADGTVAAWNPGHGHPQDWGGVFAMVVSGGRVYVAGYDVYDAPGKARGAQYHGTALDEVTGTDFCPYDNYLKALDGVTGAEVAWGPGEVSSCDYCMARVNALAVSGNTVYVGGWFSSIGGQSRNCLAALDASTGAVTDWNPGTPSGNCPSGSVSALAVSGNTVYVSGGFTSIGDSARSYIAALDASTGAATDWNPNPNGRVNAFAVSGSTVYASGNFWSIGGAARYYIAALDATTGTATAWNPAANGEVGVLAVGGNTVYVVGSFSSIGNSTRNGLAALDGTTGSATAWDPPNMNGSVGTLVVDGDVVRAGGNFTSIGGQARSNLAALDISTGIATDWDPNVGGYVSTLAVSEGTVYVGGSFTSIGGQSRNCLAAVDASTGGVTDWNPNPVGASSPYASTLVSSLALSVNAVYVGGSFSSIGGSTRNGLAALDAATGIATDWDPNAGGYVSALAVSGGTVYVGGDFSSIGDSARNSIAALDAATGIATDWNPDANYQVNAFAVSGGTVYVGGWFSSIGGQSRNCLAAVDASTGDVTDWDPNPDRDICALAVSGNTVYVGGDFWSIGGAARYYIAALDATTGTATAWNPNAGTLFVMGQPRPAVFALAVRESTVYVGGNFTSIDWQPRGGFVGIGTGDSPTATLLSRFDAEVGSGGVLLHWQFGAAVQRVTVERAAGESGSWATLPIAVHEENGVSSALDRTAEPGRSYWYRLAVTLNDGTPATFGPIRAELPGRMVASGLTRLAPNPSSGPARIDYEVAQRENVRLSVVDVAGREVEVLAKGSTAPGRYSVVWDGLRGAMPVAAGLYFLRWESPGRSMQKRIVLIR